MTKSTALLPPLLVAISALDNPPHMIARCDSCTKHVADVVRADRSALLGSLAAMSPGCDCRVCLMLRQGRETLAGGA